MAAGVAVLAGAGLAGAGSPAVEHTVARQHGFFGRFSLATFKPVMSVRIAETWIDRERGARRDVIRRDGAVVEDQTCAPPACETDIGNQDARAMLRSDVAAGKAKFIRRATIHGRPARWYRYGTARNGDEVAVDARTNLLVRRSTRNGRVYQSTEYVVDEYLPRRSQDFEPHAPWPVLTGQSRPEGQLVTAAAAARALPGAVWPGRSVGGVKVRTIRDRHWTAVTKAGQHLAGTILDVRYGPRLAWLGDRRPSKPPTTPAVEIIQAASNDSARWFTLSPPAPGGVPYPPPTGLFDLADSSFGYEYAVLRKPGVWLVVRATSFRLMQATLRSLQPIGLTQVHFAPVAVG